MDGTFYSRTIQNQDFIGDLKSDHTKSRYISNPVFQKLVLNIEIRKLLSRFQRVFDKMPATCLDFKWLGVQILDPILNMDHLQTKLILTIQNRDVSRFQFLTLVEVHCLNGLYHYIKLSVNNRHSDTVGIRKPDIRKLDSFENWTHSKT